VKKSVREDGLKRNERVPPNVGEAFFVSLLEIFWRNGAAGKRPNEGCRSVGARGGRVPNGGGAANARFLDQIVRS